MGIAGQSTPPPAAPEGEHAEGGLREGAIGLVGATAESIGDVGPSASVGLGAALVAATAGNGAWLSWLLCTVAVLCVAFLCSFFARRHATSGGMPRLLAAGNAQVLGLIAAVCILAWYCLVLPGNILGTSLLLQSWLATVHVTISSFEFFLIGAALTWLFVYVALQRIEVVALVIGILETITVGMLLILVVAILVHHPSDIFSSQHLTLKGLTFHSLLAGVVLGIFGFAGFEASTTLGAETKDAHRTIPRSLYLTCLSCGLFFVLMAFVLPLGFIGSHTSLGESADPLSETAHMNGVGWLASPLTLGVAISLFGSGVAIIVSGSRFLCEYASHRLLPKAFAIIDPTHQTPRRAAFWWAGAYGSAFWCVLAITNNDRADVWSNITTMWTLLYAAAYICAMAAAMWRGGGQAGWWLRTVAGVLGIAMFGYGIYTSIIPAPAFPTNVYTYTGAGIIVLAIVLAVVAKYQLPTVLARLRAPDAADIPDDPSSDAIGVSR